MHKDTICCLIQMQLEPFCFHIFELVPTVWHQ